MRVLNISDGAAILIWPTEDDAEMELVSLGYVLDRRNSCWVDSARKRAWVAKVPGRGWTIRKES